ncbi:MAG: diacylglyceryl transferase, partial [Chitinophagia bacterium]|nr:diacylglyceryl transferase [Chitinophagia bacterium]
MYPNLYFFIKQVFGVEPFGFTKYLNSFGILVAIAFFVAAYFLRKELIRKEKLNLLSPYDETIIVGKPASFSDLLTNALFGFLVGYKILGIFLNKIEGNPQEYIFSSQGSITGGILLAAIFST